MSSAFSQHYSLYTSRLSNIVEIVSHIFCACHFGTKTIPPTTTIPHDQRILFLKDEYEEIFDSRKKFLFKVIKNDMNLKAIIRMAQHHCWENLHETETWFTLVWEGISNNYSNTSFRKSDSVDPFMAVFMGILDIEDEVAAKRIEESTDFYLKMMRATLQNNSKDIFDRLANWIPKLLTNARFKIQISKREQKNILIPLLDRGGYSLNLKT